MILFIVRFEIRIIVSFSVSRGKGMKPQNTSNGSFNVVYWIELKDPNHQFVYWFVDLLKRTVFFLSLLFLLVCIAVSGIDIKKKNKSSFIFHQLKWFVFSFHSSPAFEFWWKRNSRLSKWNEYIYSIQIWISGYWNNKQKNRFIKNFILFTWAKDCRRWNRILKSKSKTMLGGQSVWPFNRF